MTKAIEIVYVYVVQPHTIKLWSIYDDNITAKCFWVPDINYWWDHTVSFVVRKKDRLNNVRDIPMATEIR